MNISKKYKKLRPKPKLSQCIQKLWITENYRRSLKSMERPKPNLSQLPQKLRITENYQRPLTSRECLNRPYQADLLYSLSCYFRPVLLRIEYLEFKTEDMCDKAVDEYPYNLRYVPDCFNTQEMCVKAFNVNPYNFEYIPGRFKTQEMCSDKFHFSDEVDDIPDWFITLEMIEIVSRPCCARCDFEFDEWFNGYKERKAQKSQIRDELMPIAWHPDRVIDWCFDEEEKKDLMRVWGSVEL